MLYVLAAKAPTYQAKANLLLANSLAPPTAPTPTWETLVYLAEVLTKVVAAPDAKQALVQAGASGYQLAVDD